MLPILVRFVDYEALYAVAQARLDSSEQRGRELERLLAGQQDKIERQDTEAAALRSGSLATTTRRAPSPQILLSHALLLLFPSALAASLPSTKHVTDVIDS